MTLVYPNYENLKPLFPHARRDILQPFTDALPIGDAVIGSVLRLAHFIGECGYETDYFRTYEEYASGDEYEHRADLGNTHAGDGRRYKGHGPIQCTGRFNHRKATPYVRALLNRSDIDLEADPMLIVNDRAVGFATSLWYWDVNHLNRWADRNDAAAVARGVNRGNPLSEHPARGENDRIALTSHVLVALQRIQGTQDPSRASQESKPLPPGYLHRGDRGEAVKALQRLLNTTPKARPGMQLKVDGDFGDKTEAVVMAFQKANNLAEDGIAGPDTIAALKQKE